MSEIDQTFDEFSKIYGNIPVKFSDLTTMMKNMIENFTKTNEIQQDAIWEAVNELTDYVKEIEYHRMRDMHFFISVLESLKLANKDALSNTYKSWCEEFDRLNRG